jgi:hypothetical protein
MPATYAKRPQAPHLDDETLQIVRPQVRDILMSSEGFRKLPPDEQKSLAAQMVKVASYIANPGGLAKEELGPGGGVLARAQADAVEATKERLSQAPGFAGKDFVPGATRAGVEQFGELVKKVDFPMFVSGLIQNVFQAIVDSSIKQMRAYGELLANVAKTVDQFAQDNITPNNARDWLVQSFPDDLEIDTTSMAGGFEDGVEVPPQPKVTTKGDDPEAVLQRISEALQIAKTISDLSDEEQEARLVQAARLQIARSRQQLLSSMVILGINRIVVTDGLIHAKVVFDMRASDVARRRAKASMFDQRKETEATQTNISYSSWFSPIDASYGRQTTNEHVATVESSVDEASESKAELKAKLTGEVRVNFKSDYFPMEKLASPQMIAAIQGNAKPMETPAAAAPATGGKA